MDEPESWLKVGGRYQIVSPLGGGGFGQTYLAIDTHLPGRPQCVVKHLKPRLTDTLSLETAQRLFETEAQVLYRLNGYSQVPRLLAHFEEDREFYLVQEFIPGANLSQEVVLGRQVSQEAVIALLQDILEILVHVHQHNIIHRDIKPSNLIRRAVDGRVVLIDFGAVKQISNQVIQVHSHTTRTIAIGSPGYMPSEQMAGKPRFCSDLYAVGMLGIQALTSLHPKDCPEDPRTGEVMWRDRVPEVTPALADVLDKMVRYDFRQRYPTALEALTDLNALTPDRPLFPPVITSESSVFPQLETSIQPFTGGGSPGLVLRSERGIDYSELESLLKAECWQEADALTHQLLLQCCSVGRGSSEVARSTNCLLLDDLRQFPCRDLYTLDYLWLDHSDGLFGLSVQQEIWRSVGGHQSPISEDWDRLLKRNQGRWRVNSPWVRFGIRVGWHHRNDWLAYSDLDFSLDAPKGHLPYWRSGSHIGAFFARMEVCKPYLPAIEITQEP